VIAMAAPKKPRLALPAPAGASYEVGYAKPPVATRFSPGRSGNPAGRPKGARNKVPALHEERLKEIVLAEAYRTIKVVDGERQVTVPMAQAVVRAVAVNAAKGHHRAQRLFTELVARVESANVALHKQFLKTALDYKAHWEHEIESARRRGLPEPDPVPHPRDIVIIPATGEVQIHGPMTKEQREAGHELIRRMQESQNEIDELKADRAKTRSAAKRAFLDQEIAYEERIVSRIRGLIMRIDWLRKAWVEKGRQHRSLATPEEG